MAKKNILDFEMPEIEDIRPNIEESIITLFHKHKNLLTPQIAVLIQMNVKQVEYYLYRMLNNKTIKREKKLVKLKSDKQYRNMWVYSMV